MLAGGTWIALRRFDDPAVTDSTSGSPAFSSRSAETVVFLGDSYTAGFGASDASHRWTTVLAGLEGWTEINLGRGGTGYLVTSGSGGCGLEFCPNYAGMIPEAVAADPAVVVVAGGQNDLGSDLAQVLPAVATTFADLRAALPESVIIAVGPTIIGAVNGGTTELDAAVQRASASVGGTYVSLIDPDVLTPEMSQPDGIHVDDRGHAAIAQAVRAGLG